MKQLTGLRATGIDLTRLMERRDHIQGIPGAVGEVLRSINNYHVLYRDAREGGAMRIDDPSGSSASTLCTRSLG